MAKERNALKSGMFIAVSIVMSFCVIAAIAGTDTLFQPKQIRKVIFSLHDDIGGLQAGDPVRIGGFTVGTVRKIDVAEGNPGGLETMPYTEIVISMPRKYVLRENAVVEINGTLTGACWLNFSTLGKGRELSAGEPIAGRSGGTVALMTKLSDVMPQVQATLAQVNEKTLPALNADLAKLGATADGFTKVAGSVNGAIEPVVGKFNTVADSASSTLVEFKSLAHHADADIVPNVAAVTGTIKEKLPGILDQAGTLLVNGNKSLEAAQSALADVKATFANAKTLTDSVKEVVSGNKSKLDGIINSLKLTADNLKNASVEIRHSPWRLIYKPGPGEMANLNLFDAARQFSEGAGALKDSAEALKDASASKTLSDEELKGLMERLNRSFEKFNATEEEFWKAVKE